MLLVVIQVDMISHRRLPFRTCWLQHSLFACGWTGTISLPTNSHAAVSSIMTAAIRKSCAKQQSTTEAQKYACPQCILSGNYKNYKPSINDVFRPGNSEIFLIWYVSIKTEKQQNWFSTSVNISFDLLTSPHCISTPLVGTDQIELGSVIPSVQKSPGWIAFVP